MPGTTALAPFTRLSTSASSGFAASATGGSGTSRAMPPRTSNSAPRTGSASARFGSIASMPPCARPTTETPGTISSRSCAASERSARMRAKYAASCASSRANLGSTSTTRE
ncbi:MAG: hypothetical protein IPJ04_00340 [Candidatus Eisenbacteria bacterium]|nr:hypothetical protein [Candidatus Eisenbacteria bacterium]